MSQFISGILHLSGRAFELRGVKVRDLLAATEANKSGTQVEQEVQLLALTLLKLGDEAAPIKPYQIEDLTEIEFDQLLQARADLAKKLRGLALEAQSPSAQEIPAFLQKSPLPPAAPAAPASS